MRQFPCSYNRLRSISFKKTPEQVIGRTVLTLVHKRESIKLGNFIKEVIKKEAWRNYLDALDIASKYLK
jgi:hypothetical protein